MRRLARQTVAVAAALVLLAGCGADPGPREAVPELGSRLEAVDAAVVDRDWDRARTELESLVSRAEAAAQGGDISGEQADRIRLAATGLLERLPGGAQEDGEPEDHGDTDQSRQTAEPTTEDTDEPEESTEDEPEKPAEPEQPAPEESREPAQREPTGKGNEDNPGKGNEDNPGKGNEGDPGKGNEGDPGKGNEGDPGKGNEDNPGKGND